MKLLRIMSRTLNVNVHVVIRIYIEEEGSQTCESAAASRCVHVQYLRLRAHDASTMK